MSYTTIDEIVLCDLEHPHLKLQKDKDNAGVLGHLESKLTKTTSWYNATRVSLINLNIIFDYFRHSFLPRLFSIAGLLYGVELLFEIGVILYETFAPNLPNKDLSHWQRFKNALTPERVSNMVNSAVWFGVNLTAFILTGGVSAILNVAGFSFDILHEAVRSQIQINKNKLAIKNIEEKIDRTNEKLQNTSDEFPQKKAILSSKMAYLQETRLRLQVDTRKKQWKMVYNIACLSLFTLGLAMVFFPPTFIPGAVLIGGSLSMIAGNICIGLGAKIRGLIPARGDKTKIKEQKPTSENSYKRYCSHILKSDVGNTLINSSNKTSEIVIKETNSPSLQNTERTNYSSSMTFFETPASSQEKIVSNLSSATNSL